ncbi:hypothetical protein [Stenotrophomonas maltophilia]|nr:hypothetical protein [Stenotrophomonas maltophilia]
MSSAKIKDARRRVHSFPNIGDQAISENWWRKKLPQAVRLISIRPILAR